MAGTKQAVRGCIRRRAFLAGMAGGAAAWLLAGRGSGAAEAPPASGAAKPRIRLVFSHHRVDAAGKQSEPGWPYLGYDCDKAKREVLEKLKVGCPGIEFLPETAYDPADAKKILEKDAEVDGYLAFMVGGWASAGMTIAEAGKPIIFAGDVYGTSGEILVSYAAAKRRGLRAAVVSSTRFEDVCDALRSFECLKRLRSSAILDVGADPGEGGKAIEDAFGTKVVPIAFPEINEIWQKADPLKAREWADRWIRGAARVVEPSREEIEKSAAMYLALRELLEGHRAEAVTMNCLGGVYSGQTHAYPCLGFFQINSDGGVGACEADLESTISMLVMKHLVGKPGYISDPVIDTVGNRVVYVHCVAPNKVHGPKGPENPYEIRSHAEDRKGAAVRSIMPLGEMTTTLRFSPGKKQVIVHRAKTVENIDDERSCRSKLAAELQGDMEKLWSEWDQWGWHRVTFYGDHLRAVEQLAALAGFAVVREC
jgi:L-fucose isomerase-like protein